MASAASSLPKKAAFMCSKRQPSGPGALPRLHFCSVVSSSLMAIGDCGAGGGPALQRAPRMSSISASVRSTSDGGGNYRASSSSAVDAV